MKRYRHKWRDIYGHNNWTLTSVYEFSLCGIASSEEINLWRCLHFFFTLSSNNNKRKAQVRTICCFVLHLGTLFLIFKCFSGKGKHFMKGCESHLSGVYSKVTTYIFSFRMQTQQFLGCCDTMKIIFQERQVLQQWDLILLAWLIDPRRKER